MKVKFLKEYRCYKKGQVVDIDGGLADIVIHRNFAEPIIDSKVVQKSMKEVFNKSMKPEDVKNKGFGNGE